MANIVSFVTFLLNLLNIPIPIPVEFIPSLWTLLSLITTFIATSNFNFDLVTNPNSAPFRTAFSTMPSHFDFIIVGAGSAGAVLANRLTANSRYKVLLLEAGGNPLPLNTIPALAAINLHHPETDWMYKSVPQKFSAFGVPDNRVPLARGKSLGGSSNLNMMIYMRGNPKDFDNWANLTNDSQWSYEDVLPYFRKSENYRGNFPNPQHHGVGGPMTVSSQSYQPLVQEWMSAAKEFGLNNSDPNAEQTSTFSPIDVTIKNGMRGGTYQAFLRPILQRPNLHIVRYAHVLKVKLDSNNWARGVVYFRHGRKISVTASKEVILSAGAFGTPLILQRSGIGPKKILDSFGIQVKVDLPGVGHGLQDHVLTAVGPFLLNDTVSYIVDRNATLRSAIDYAFKRLGPISSNGMSGTGLISTSEPKDPSWPNICAFQEPFGIHESAGSDLEQLFGLAPKFTNYLREFNGQDATFVVYNLGRPQSVGTVEISGTRIEDPPLIDPNYYSDPEQKDIKAMIQAFRFFVNFYETSETWKKYNAKLIPKPVQACEAHPLKSDDYYECYIRHFTATSWHPCCTAKMGHQNDPMAVLDSNFRVRHVSGLRVVDASAMPQITNANLNAPTIMIGEKGADYILQSWG